MSRLKTPRNCEWCDAEFRPWQKDSRFCSRRCTSTWLATTRDFSGANNPRYNGGLSLADGRTIVCCRDGSYILYSRALMEAEIRRPLRSDEIVHHVNGDKTDDRVENLQITTRGEHMNMHRHEFEERRRESSIAARRRRAAVERERKAAA